MCWNENQLGPDADDWIINNNIKSASRCNSAGERVTKMVLQFKSAKLKKPYHVILGGKFEATNKHGIEKWYSLEMNCEWGNLSISVIACCCNYEKYAIWSVSMHSCHSLWKHWQRRVLIHICSCQSYKCLIWSSKQQWRTSPYIHRLIPQYLWCLYKYIYSIVEHQFIQFPTNLRVDIPMQFNRKPATASE